MKTNPETTNNRRFYGHGIPGVQLEDLTGRLIVVEGADGSGRSTQIARLVDSLETGGHATVQVGLKRSTLVSSELEGAQEGNILSRTTRRILPTSWKTSFCRRSRRVSSCWLTVTFTRSWRATWCAAWMRRG